MAVPDTVFSLQFRGYLMLKPYCELRYNLYPPSSPLPSDKIIIPARREATTTTIATIATTTFLFVVDLPSFALSKLFLSSYKP
jgi:hypothetical protein